MNVVMRTCQVIVQTQCGSEYGELLKPGDKVPEDGDQRACIHPEHSGQLFPARFIWLPGESPCGEPERPAGIDPLQWLTDRLTLRYGPPQVQPPQTPGIAAVRQHDGLIWVSAGPGAAKLRRAWRWQDDETPCLLFVDTGGTLQVVMEARERRATVACLGMRYPPRTVLESLAEYIYRLDETGTDAISGV